MNVDVRQISGHVAKLAWVALRAFAGTVALLVFAGGVLATLSYHFLSDHHWVYGAVSAWVAVSESLAAGVLFGAQRAVVMVAAHGFGELRLGRSLVRVVFERMLVGVSGEGQDQQSTLISRGLKRLPLAQADELLTRAVRSVMGDAEQGSWLKRTVQGWLLEAVRKYTLARFREEGKQHGGIDLHAVQTELEQTVDDAIVEKLRGGLRLWTAAVIIGLPCAVAGQTWIILMTLRSYG